MKALVVGGTKGFGKAVAERLKKSGCADVVTTGRSGGDYKVDVGDTEEWQHALDELRGEGALDLVVFIAGYARAQEPSKRTEKDLARHEQSNVGYVRMALDGLVLSPNATVTTIGSQWSYKGSNEELAPYIKAKHELRKLTETFAREHPKMSVLHICVPPMNTPQRDEVWSQHGTKPEQTSGIETADPEIIAQTLVKEVTTRRGRGETLQIETSGKIHEVDLTETRYELR